MTDDAADFGDVSGHTEVAAHILLDIFLLLCTLLLLNLLIAFLTDAYAQVSENKDKAFALANAEAVVELAEQARNSIRCASSRRYLALSNAPLPTWQARGGWLPAPLNVLQTWGVVSNDMLSTSRSAPLVLTLAIAPIVLVLHWVLLVLASPALVVLTVMSGKRGYYNEQKKRCMPDHWRAAREVLEKVVGLALLLPINLVLSELRVAVCRWTLATAIEPGEWVVVLNCKTHSTMMGMVSSYDPDDPGCEYLVQLPVTYTDGDIWVTSHVEKIRVEGMHLMVCPSPVRAPVHSEGGRAGRTAHVS